MKDIKGYEGMYAVTECGHVWSHKRKLFLKPTNTNGYLYVHLSKNGKVQSLGIHRLVAEAYIPNPENKPQVHHIDKNRANNCINNLQWVTAKENCNTDNRNKNIGRTNSKPVYCVELDRTFNSITEAAEELNLSVAAISMCCHGKIKTSGKLHWKFIEEC